MAEKPEIGKKEKLKKEAAVSSVEIKQKYRLNGTAHSHDTFLLRIQIEQLMAL